MTAFAPMDVFGCPLEGVNLIEASAGTGKTWTICGLYLRMLLEQRRAVDQILVVTFTNAATAELRERIRSHVVACLNHFRRGSGTSGDPFARGLAARLEGELGRDRLDLIRLLELALETFDEAAIHTIHGFCQRALAEIPFAAGLPFESELVHDDALLIQQAANDFWRRHVAGDGTPGASIPRGLAIHLLQSGDDPEKYARLLRRALAKPLAPRRWPEDLDTVPAPDAGAWARAFARARAIWLAEADAIEQRLLDSLSQLDGRSYKAEAIRSGKAVWNVRFASVDALAVLPPGSAAETDLYSATRLAVCTRKGATTPRHAFFAAVDALLQAGKAHEAALCAERLRLLRRVVEEVPHELRQRKRRDRVVAFDDMLFNLHQALISAEFPWLSGALRARYPAALIDEFQDTDPLQFQIFRTLYETNEIGAGPLFMVGDPKQAIYGFRNADLHTYLGAQKLASGRYTLEDNQRSGADLIAACNALFGLNPRAFLVDGIDYRPVRKGEKPVPELLDSGGETRGPLHLWLLPRDEEGDWMTRAEATDRVAPAVAAEIVRLLSNGRSGRLQIAGRGVRAADIAVLVRSHGQGQRMRQALSSGGVGSVELSQASVFRTPEAEDVERVLLAVAEPANECLIRAALATELLGCDAAALDAMNGNETVFFDRVERFTDYRALWEQRGFAMMFRKLLREEGVQRRLLGLPRGERRLTNVLHLAELLAEAASAHVATDALLRWFGNRRREADAGDAAQLRLESDSDLVQIVTIHKSKGLEYPIVFCPFLWDGQVRLRTDSPDVIEYHERDGTAVLDFRPEARGEKAIDALRKQELAAETLRMIYVALTRAVHRCYVVAGCYKRAKTHRACSADSLHAMLNWLVCGASFEPGQWASAKVDPVDIEAAWLELGRRHGGACQVEWLPNPSGPALQAVESGASQLAPRPAPGPIEPSWNRSSFSGLIRSLEAEADAVDHDTNAETVAVPEQTAGEGLPADDILAFPRGPAAGECIHHLFEHVDFVDPSGWDAAIGAALAAHPQGTLSVDGGLFPSQLRRMLHDVLATDLGHGLRLGSVETTHRLSELAFTLPAGRLQPDELNRFLVEHRYPVGRLEFATVKGYLSGAIDLVFRHAGRYYLLDWKSNHLGDASDDYAQEWLDRAMTAHAYRLQYLIYSIALQRFLRRSLARYDYERDFGGIFYLFVRGVRPGWTTSQGPAGVFFDRPSSATLRVLDALIGDVGAGTVG